MVRWREYRDYYASAQLSQDCSGLARAPESRYHSGIGNRRVGRKRVACRQQRTETREIHVPDHQHACKFEPAAKWHENRVDAVRFLRRRAVNSSSPHRRESFTRNTSLFIGAKNG
jgi:hypothetical protein